MSSPASPVPAQELSTSLSEYVIYDPAAIHEVLRGVMDANALLLLYCGGEEEFVLTSILEIGDEDLVLDRGPDEAMNRRLLASERLLAVTQHDRVRVQFSSRRATQVLYQDREAFSIPVPEQLLRLQRREYYRLPAPTMRPPRCHITLPGHERVEARILDISCGGLAVVGLPPGLTAEAGTRFGECRLELPDVATLNVALEVRNVFDMTLRNGQRTRRCGCAFVNAPESVLAQIQRYIIRVERERHARDRFG